MLIKAISRLSNYIPIHTPAGPCSKETSVPKSRKAHSDGLDSYFWEEEENPALDHKSKTKPRDDFLRHQTDEDGILGRKDREEKPLDTKVDENWRIR